MHLPDGWLNLEVSLLSWTITLIAIGLSLAKFDQSDLDRLSRIGAIASVVFVAQMFNFPVAGGTSGHLLGAALSVYVVGLPGAILTLFVVLLIQALLFADGGILALGANTLNMGVIGALTVYLILKIYPPFRDPNNRKQFLVGVFLSAFFAVVISALFAGLELVWSGKVAFNTAIPLILFWHLLIGIGEGVISVFIISYLMQVDFPIFDPEQDERPLLETLQQSNRPILGLGILLGFFSLLSLFASQSPDGLESAGERLGISEGDTFSAGIADDYQFLGMDTLTGVLLSALLGIIIISGLLFLPVVYLRERRETSMALMK